MERSAISDEYKQVRTRYDRACDAYDRWMYITIGSLLVCLCLVTLVYQMTGNRPVIWNSLWSLLDLGLILCCVKQLTYYVRIKRDRMQLAWLIGEPTTVLTPFTFAPHEHISMRWRPVSYSQGIVWRNFPISLMFASVGTVATLVNIVHGGLRP